VWAVGGASNGVTDTCTGVILAVVKMKAVGGRRWKRKEGGVGRGWERGDDDKCCVVERDDRTPRCKCHLMSRGGMKGR
jgi:hypothetical protein